MNILPCFSVGELIPELRRNITLIEVLLTVANTYKEIRICNLLAFGFQALGFSSCNPLGFRCVCVYVCVCVCVCKQRLSSGVCVFANDG
jgi:hypothetical protein